MKIVEADFDFVQACYKRTKLFDILKQFAYSGMKCAEVQGFTNKATSCAGALNKSIKHFKFNNFKAISRSEKVYLLNMALIKEDV